MIVLRLDTFYVNTGSKERTQPGGIRERTKVTFFPFWNDGHVTRGISLNQIPVALVCSWEMRRSPGASCRGGPPVVPIRRFAPMISLFASVLLAGCRIDTHNNGKNNDVSIGTPFGSLNVKTDQANAVAQTGLTPYPGSKPTHENGDDNNAADVNMSFGSFKLGVHAVELQTSDPPDKVLAFYRKDMSRYGFVITCHGHHTVGEPSRTVAGLSCDSDNGGASNEETELRAGSVLHQHIVGVHTENGGTRIGLVALDLPADTDKHESGDRE